MDPRALQSLKRFNNIWSEILDIYDELGYTAVEKIMYYLVEQEQCGEEATQKELCDLWLLNKQTVNSAIGRMEKMGHVTRSVSEEDKRKKVLKLTEEGRKAAYEIALPAREAELKAFADLSPEESDMLIRLLDKYAMNLKKEYKQLKNE